ncbi:hypothetical protein ASPZODRAFT_12590 [Penicilliopsis zonata CBS 506.65]|uniref:Zn(2)-C6 fungal-type domain-containing protein n=1 Tax=Penicilliopsis zonata CBS 506.65 TaxID=1073090 RepID=A0A1L9SXK5_9EURO|nr:hypothetical protein ASPZODRAFT_12590 [Penicilliopsis zonata CBS 506.65]OJJ51783.1 hypothetical protein ASPZODRAFT_12590 [Penicilliopsis zonata CBS 506.65]
MPRVAPEDRKRAFRPKTRTGCSTCKSVFRVNYYSERRVKCGEERPACLRCTSTGRKCDGYSTQASPSQSSPPSQSPPSPPASFNSLLLLPSPSTSLFTSDQERRSFHFFLSRTAPQLAGDFKCAFWERLLLQAAHHEPAIRHVTVALGSLHEHFERDEGAPFRSGQMTAHSSFALRQYLRAMRCLMPAHGASQPLDVCLVSCILFACFEAMRGYYGSAITHITSGLKILGEFKANTVPSLSSYLAVSGASRTPYVPVDILCGLFTRLEAQAMVTVRHMNGSNFSNLWPELVIDLSRPVVFHSLAEAREMLELYTYHYRVHNTNLQNDKKGGSGSGLHPPSCAVSPATLRDTSLALLAKWSVALDVFLRQRGESLTDRDRRGAMVLQMRKIDCYIALDILRESDDLSDATDADQVKWDRYCPLFDQMVQIGESIVLLSTTATTESGTSFSLDLGITGCMFNAAARCRDPAIRRRAVQVLRAAAVQEGVWNSRVVAEMAQQWIAIEEEGLVLSPHTCADVPSCARLTHFYPMFDADRRSAMVYFCSHGLDAGREVLLQW